MEQAESSTPVVVANKHSEDIAILQGTGTFYDASFHGAGNVLSSVAVEDFDSVLVG
jgi:hypothetical protein